MPFCHRTPRYEAKNGPLIRNCHAMFPFKYRHLRLFIPIQALRSPTNKSDKRTWPNKAFKNISDIYRHTAWSKLHIFTRDVIGYESLPTRQCTRCARGNMRVNFLVFFFHRFRLYFYFRCITMVNGFLRLTRWNKENEKFVPKRRSIIKSPRWIILYCRRVFNFNANYCLCVSFYLCRSIYSTHREITVN